VPESLRVNSELLAKARNVEEVRRFSLESERAGMHATKLWGNLVALQRARKEEREKVLQQLRDMQSGKASFLLLCLTPVEPNPNFNLCPLVVSGGGA
jgi:hypothetical protein